MSKSGFANGKNEYLRVHDKLSYLQSVAYNRAISTIIYFPL
jgi:hypothetical protein